MVKKSIVATAEKYIRQIPKNLDLRKAYLFGSCAKGVENEDSDIDIALIVGKMDDFFSLQMQLMRLRRNVDLRIEPHPILEKDFTKQNPLAFEVQKYGIELQK